MQTRARMSGEELFIVITGVQRFVCFVRTAQWAKSFTANHLQATVQYSDYDIIGRYGKRESSLENVLL
jgi:hypothetical protein